MIGRKARRKSEIEEIVEPKSFDDYELRLGDIMRGERATMGKSPTRGGSRGPGGAGEHYQ